MVSWTSNHTSLFSPKGLCVHFCGATKWALTVLVGRGAKTTRKSAQGSASDSHNIVSLLLSRNTDRDMTGVSVALVFHLLTHFILLVTGNLFPQALKSMRC